jgi:predicted  nucleic acid-binding Zn-ribbon protein
MEHEEKHPLKDDPKLSSVEQKYQDRYTDTENSENIDYRCHAYGTTLMVAAMNEKYWFAFQVGDGKCVVLYDDGTWALPIPWDDNCTFNTTTSICDDNSLGKFRYWFGWKNDDGGYNEYGYGIDSKSKIYENKSAIRPLAIFIGTDGVEDSYPRVDNDKYVINFYRNRIVTLAKGFNGFDEEIKGFAERFAERESTDDVSIAGIIGDFSGEPEMITKMKYESANHETSEQLTIKKRDVEEKRDALVLLRKQSSVKFDAQKQLEEKIANLEDDIKKLTAKKKSLETILAKAKSDVNESEKSLGELQVKGRELEGKCKELEAEQRVIDAKIAIIEDELTKAKKILGKVENEYNRKREDFCKKQKKSNKLLNELSAMPPTLKGNNGQSTESDNAQTTNTVGGVYTKEQTTTSFSNILEDALSAFGVASDVGMARQLEKLNHEIQRLEIELQNLQGQVVAARQNYEAKSRECGCLKQSLTDLHQRKKRIETALIPIRQNYQNAERQITQQRADIKRHEREIEQIEKQIPTKQAEIEKLKVDSETLKTQNNVQHDRIATLESTFQKAEQEVKELEDKIKQSTN